MRHRFSIWLRGFRYRLACRISPDGRTADELRHDLAVAQADAAYAKSQAQMATARLEATEKQLGISQTAERNAVTRATEMQFKYEDALKREAQASEDHIRTLKTIANTQVFASGSRVRMFDGVGPTLPEPTVQGPVAPFSSRMRGRQAVNHANSDFMKHFQESMNRPIDDTVPSDTEPATASA